MDDYDKLIGANIRRLREANDLSQAALAKLMNERGWAKWSQPTVAAIEKGERSLKFAEAVTLLSMDMFDVRDASELLRLPREDIWWAAVGSLKKSQTALELAVKDFWRSQLRAARASDELLAAGEDVPEEDELSAIGCDVAEIIADLDIYPDWHSGRGPHETALLEGPLREHDVMARREAERAAGMEAALMADRRAETERRVEDAPSTDSAE